LAAQVLSDTVGHILKEFGPPEAVATSEFCLNMDKFFDCCNVRNTEEYKRKRKPFLRPFENVADERFL
jgi:ribosomal protein S26